MVVMIMMVVVMVTMVLVVPMTLMDPPALLIVVVVRMAPVRACIGRSLPQPRNPDVPSAPSRPVTVDPHIAIPWHSRTSLISDRWRRGPDDD
jgi:hypothetical protein